MAFGSEFSVVFRLLIAAAAFLADCYGVGGSSGLAQVGAAGDDLTPSR